MYDARLGRRWELDPITYPWQSSYASFNNNPIYFIDPLGLEGNTPENGDKGGSKKVDDSSKKKFGVVQPQSNNKKKEQSSPSHSTNETTVPLTTIEKQPMPKDALNVAAPNDVLREPVKGNPVAEYDNTKKPVIYVNSSLYSASNFNISNFVQAVSFREPGRLDLITFPGFNLGFKYQQGSITGGFNTSTGFESGVKINNYISLSVNNKGLEPSIKFNQFNLKNGSIGYGPFKFGSSNYTEEYVYKVTDFMTILVGDKFQSGLMQKIVTITNIYNSVQTPFVNTMNIRSIRTEKFPNGFTQSNLSVDTTINSLELGCKLNGITGSVTYPVGGKKN